MDCSAHIFIFCIYILQFWLYRYDISYKSKYFWIHENIVKCNKSPRWFELYLANLFNRYLLVHEDKAEKDKRKVKMHENEKKRRVEFSLQPFQDTVVFWGSIIWLMIFAQFHGFILLKRAENLELWRLAEVSSGIFFCYSFWKNNAGKKILRCTFLHFER